MKQISLQSEEQPQIPQLNSDAQERIHLVAQLAGLHTACHTAVL